MIRHAASSTSWCRPRSRAASMPCGAFGADDDAASPLPAGKPRVSASANNTSETVTSDAHPARPLYPALRSRRGGAGEFRLRSSLHKDALREWGHPTSDETVRRKLGEWGYSLQGNRKSLEGSSPPERDEQFRYINRLVKSFLRRGEPVLSIDTKKKERVGKFKNGGRIWRRKGEPEEVNIVRLPELGGRYGDSLRGLRRKAQPRFCERRDEP